jgi:cytochrome P450 family 710 subfamily A protein
MCAANIVLPGCAITFLCPCHCDPTACTCSRCYFATGLRAQDTLLLALHPNAKRVLGKRNIAFLHGPEHKALRKSFLALFTRKALAVSVTLR